MLLVVVSCRGLGCLLQFRESLLLTSKPNQTKRFLRRVCEHCAFTAFTADWLLPVVALRVTRARNQSDGAVGGTMLEIPSQNATPSVHGELIALQTSFCDVFIANVHIAITITIRLIVQAY